MVASPVASAVVHPFNSLSSNVNPSSLFTIFPTIANASPPMPERPATTWWPLACTDCAISGNCEVIRGCGQSRSGGRRERRGERERKREKEREREREILGKHGRFEVLLNRYTECRYVFEWLIWLVKERKKVGIKEDSKAGDPPQN